MGLRNEIRLLRRGRDWRGRATVPRSAQPWAPRRQRKQFPTSWARSTPARLARSAVQAGALKPVVWTETRPRVYGADLLDEVRGPVVLVSNHTSHLDAPLIFGSLPKRMARRTAVGAAADYFFDARWRALATALVFNAFPVERQGSRTSTERQAPLSLAHRLLRRGWNLVLFPEGTRSTDGWVQRFRFGAAQLCTTAGVPAVPMAIRGTYAAMPKGHNWPRSGRPAVAVRYGRPVYPREGESVRDFSARLEDEVGRLWVEQDEGWWESLHAADRRERPKGPQLTGWRRVWESTRPLAHGDRHRRVWRR